MLRTHWLVTSSLDYAARHLSSRASPIQQAIEHRDEDTGREMSLSSDSSEVPTDEWESEAEEVSGDDSPPVGGEARGGLSCTYEAVRTGETVVLPRF